MEKRIQQLDLLQHTDTVNELLARYGVKFGIYKNNVFKEQLFPFDAIPRIIEHEEFLFLERGLKQRVMALNLFIKDIYSKKQIVKDGIVPEDFIFASSGYMAECENAVPPKGIYASNIYLTEIPQIRVNALHEEQMADGMLFTIREYPIVDEGSLVGRLLRV